MLNDRLARPGLLAGPGRRQDSDKLFRKIGNRAILVFSMTANPWSHNRNTAREIPKTMNPNFLSDKPLISHISAKKKFAKICKTK
jgi:hypothetical protein